MPELPHAFFLVFLFALGACIGSFLNVVVWRLPQGESLVRPPSHCPKCGHLLAWRDNIPVFGWIFLRGKCRYCKAPISPRYPIIEAVTGLLFAFYYAAFFMWGLWRVPAAVDFRGHSAMLPADIARDWPTYGLYMFMVSSLLAASLIDAESFFIPLSIPWLMAAVGVVFHPIADRPGMPGSLAGIGPVPAALAAGAGVGLLLAIGLWWLGRIPSSFAEGEPLLEIEREELLKEVEEAKRQGKPEEEIPQVPPPYTRGEIRREMRKEMLFLMAPLLLGGLAVLLASPGRPLEMFWSQVLGHVWLRGLLGSVLGALVGAFVVWFFRIAGTLALGRVAMGLGDVHLMFGVGAILGAGPALVAFFIAPFFGIGVALWGFIFNRRRELPYGPYLSLASAATLLCYQPIAARFAPGFEALIWMIRQAF